MTRIALLSSDYDLCGLGQALRRAAPELDVRLQGEEGAMDAEVAVCWNPEQGALAQLRRLRLVHSIAAGVDHVFADGMTPKVPVCRVVDPDLKRAMAEYVLWGVLFYHRHFDVTQAQQRRGLWKTPTQLAASQRKVGVMGLGELGGYVALQLAALGFDVRGWSRSAKRLDGVKTWAGPAQLPAFLHGLDCLICLMPLTPETEGILNARVFEHVGHGAALINCGRGAHLVVEDLMAALASGQLRGALLDVFDQEPLGRDHPLWHTRGVTLTPHMASSASEHAIVSQVIDNVRRLQRGEALLNTVDGQHGY